MSAGPEVKLHMFTGSMFSSLALAGANCYSPKQHPGQVSGGSIHQGLLPKGRRIVSDLDPFHLHRPLTLFQHGLHLEAALITSIPYFSIKKVCCDVMQHSKLDFRRFELKVMQKRSAMFRDVG